MTDNWAATFLRRLKILHIIPEQQLYTAKKIADILYNQEHIDVNHRTIERDLKHFVTPLTDSGDNDDSSDISDSMGLTKEDFTSVLPIEKVRFNELPEDGCRFGYRWLTGKKREILSSMDRSEALVFSILNRYLESAIPSPLRHALSPYFNEAEKILSADSSRHYREWRNNIVVEQRGMPLQVADYPDGLLDTIHYALYYKKQLKLTYSEPDKETLYHAKIHPLGMIIKEPKIYLVFKDHKTGRVDTKPIIRFTHVELLPQKATRPKNFNIYQHLPHYRSNAIFDMQLHISKQEIVDNIHDNPIETIDGPPKITALPGTNGKKIYEMTCQVADSHFLRQWLLALGSHVKVIAPAMLRNELMGTLKDALANYQGHHH